MVLYLRPDFLSAACGTHFRLNVKTVADSAFKNGTASSYAKSLGLDESACTFGGCKGQFRGCEGGPSRRSLKERQEEGISSVSSTMHTAAGVVIDVSVANMKLQDATMTAVVNTQVRLMPLYGLLQSMMFAPGLACCLRSSLRETLNPLLTVYRKQQRQLRPVSFQSLPLRLVFLWHISSTLSLLLGYLFF